MSRDRDEDCSTWSFCVVIWRREDRHGLIEEVLLFWEDEIVFQDKIFSEFGIFEALNISLFVIFNRIEIPLLFVSGWEPGSRAYMYEK